MHGKENFKTYRTQRPKIQNGDVFATASKALFSKGIRKATRSKVSHVGIFLVLCDGVFIAEAMEGSGVRFMRASKRFKKEEFILLRGGNLNQKLVWDTIGDEYDLWGALVALFIDTHSSQKFCSEAVASWLQLDFSHLNRGVLPSDIVSALKVV